MFTMVQYLFLSKQFEDVWASRLWVSGVLVLEFGPILAWYKFPAAEQFPDAPNVLYVKDLDCRQANSAPGLFYYKAMLL